MPERPSKKQYELLEYVNKFVGEHGYGPSYREIMNGCNYSSVATVAVHVNNLIKKGHLRKNGRSARSLEVVDSAVPEKTGSSSTGNDKEKWLKEKIEAEFSKPESDPDELETLIKALKILGFDSTANGFQSRLEEIRQSNQ